MSNAEPNLSIGGSDGLAGGSGHEPTIPKRALYCAAQSVGQALPVLAYQGPGNWPDEGAAEDCALMRYLRTLSGDHKTEAHIGEGATALHDADDQSAGRHRNRTQ